MWFHFEFFRVKWKENRVNNWIIVHLRFEEIYAIRSLAAFLYIPFFHSFYFIHLTTFMLFRRSVGEWALRTTRNSSFFGVIFIVKREATQNQIYCHLSRLTVTFSAFYTHFSLVHVSLQVFLLKPRGFLEKQHDWNVKEGSSSARAVVPEASEILIHISFGRSQQRVWAVLRALWLDGKPFDWSNCGKREFIAFHGFGRVSK